MTSNAAHTRVVYFTAGAGGMICGSCLHDNTLARTMRQSGVDVILTPTYTPIRTDEHDSTAAPVFFGGLNVYLAQTIPGFRFLPASLTRWMDHPALIRWATQRASSTSAKSLGALTVSMLQGEHGNQRREVEQVAQWIADDAKPNLVVFSNVLIAGCLPRLKQRWKCPVIVTLQGDDIFWDSLPEPYQSQAMTAIRQLVPLVDGFVVNSEYYAELMQERLALPADKLHIVPLGIDVDGFPLPADLESLTNDDSSAPTIGYLARLSPEKGLHLLVDAFLELRRDEKLPHARLLIAGWTGATNQEYADEQLRKLTNQAGSDSFEFWGTVDRTTKVRFLRELDVFSVPTTYREPKGLFVLEALAAGIPVVAPNHGAFPEMARRLPGIRLCAPNDATSLAMELARSLENRTETLEQARLGCRAVHELANAQRMSADNWIIWQEVMRQFNAQTAAS